MNWARCRTSDLETGRPTLDVAQALQELGVRAVGGGAAVARACAVLEVRAALVLDVAHESPRNTSILEREPIFGPAAALSSAEVLAKGEAGPILFAVRRWRIPECDKYRTSRSRSPRGTDCDSSRP